MNTGKNRVKGLKTELFKKKYQTDPVVVNPTDELQGRAFIDSALSQTQQFEQRMKQDAAYRRVNPLRAPQPATQYTPRQIAAMRQNFPMSPEDFMTSNAIGITGIPDLMAGQGVDDIRNQNQILGETELLTSTPNSLRNFQDEGFNQEVKAASEQALAAKPSWFNMPDMPDINYRNAIRLGVGLTSAAKGVYDDSMTRTRINERIQNLNDQPRYMPNEYDFMGRPGSQSVIYAKDGAQIRTGTESGAEEAELERGEMFMLPNMDSYIVGGKKHSQGGEDFVLPEGTIVFSDHLKVPGTRNTFAQQAKKFDVTKYKETIENPHSKTVDRTTAEVMMDRNLKKLQELFQIQQQMNGNSNGELKPQSSPEPMRQAQAGMVNVNAVGDYLTSSESRPVTDVLNTPSVVLTPEQQAQYNSQQPAFEVNEQPAEEQAKLSLAERQARGLATYTDFRANEEDQITAEMTRLAADAKPEQGGVLGAQKPVKPQTASELAGATQADVTTAGTVSKTNASDRSSIYYKTGANGRKYFVEGQGEMEGMSIPDQYSNNPFLLLSNRIDEHYDELAPLLLSAYKTQLKNKNLNVNTPEELVDIMESGNNALVLFRDFYKSIGEEDALFNPELDLGKGDNMGQKKTAEMMQTYIESPKFLADIKAGNATTYFPWLKTQPKEIKDKNGNVTGYKLDKVEMNHEFIEKYQAAYKAVAGVKKEQQKKGKDDMLRCFRVAPEGLADHTYLNLPISPVDRWGGNTTIGQVSAFECDDKPKTTTDTPKDPALTTAEGGNYNTKVGPAPTGTYIKDKFDYPQLAPEIYGLAASQMFSYAPMDYNAPYVMPQTLNIQPQLQDVDSSYMAAINSGADPNAALIATLGAKQKLYSEKQNFDAQQRAQVDQVNASSRWQEDIQDMQSLDNVYNTLIARADDAVTAQRQAIVASASNKRAVYNMEEKKKKLFTENFVRNYKVDGKTGAITLDLPEGYDPIQLDNYMSSFANYLAQQQQIQDTAVRNAAAKKKEETSKK
jgi:hypothetical protein